MSVLDLIDKAVRLDVSCVQIADNLPLEGFSDADLATVKEYADQHQVSLEVGARHLTPDRLRRYTEIAAYLESRILRFVIDGPDYAPTIAEVTEIIQAHLPALEEHRICLAIENHDRLLSTEFADLVRRVNSEWVGICLDTVNSMGAGEGLTTVIERLGPLAVNFHVKEFTVKRIYHMMGFEIEGLPLGTGMLPVPTVLHHLGAQCKTAILEQWVPPEKDIQATIRKEERWAEESIRYLKRALV